MMRTVQVLAILVVAVCSAALADVPYSPTSPLDDAELYDWLVREEVPTSEVILCLPDAAAVAASKVQDEHRYKVGVAVPVNVTVDLGTLRPIVGARSPAHAHGALRIRSDGFVWSAVVESPGATSLRLGFEDFDLAEGVELYLYNDRGQVAGPYTGSGRRSRHSFFTRTLPTDRQHLQLRYDGTNIAATLDAIHFTISEVAHLDERFLLGRAPTTPGEREHCENLNADCVENAECDLHDPSLDPIIDAARDATAAMFFESGATWYMCTGALIESLDGTTGHFLTSNTCISTAEEAASLETYFHFTTPCPPGGGPTTDCDLADSTNSDPPTVFGAVIVDTSDLTDFSLLMLDGAPPADTTHLPWSTTPVAHSNGIELYRISHPSGAPQAFSAHEVDADWDYCGPPGDFIYSQDSMGATEGGSSGAPVFNANGEIVGQLYGHCGSNLSDDCDSVNNRTWDGAFAATWQNRPLVRHALAQEPLPEVVELATHDIPALADDEMWTTSFDNYDGYDNLTFLLTLSNGDGDLYVKFGSPPTTDSYDCRPYHFGTVDETCTFDPAEVGTYYVLVHAYSAFTDAILTITTLQQQCPDMDGDAVCDDVDNCPLDPNPFQEDADSDAAGDVCDTCPLTSNPGGGVAMFSQTLVAPDGATFVWPVPEDVLLMLGDLAGVSAYEYSSVTSVTAATEIPSGTDPAPGDGTYFLVRADCPLSTWSTGAASECPPGTCADGDRDALLP
jgi:hypothetical protein